MSAAALGTALKQVRVGPSTNTLCDQLSYSILRVCLCVVLQRSVSACDLLLETLVRFQSSAHLPCILLKPLCINDTLCQSPSEGHAIIGAGFEVGPHC